MLIFNECFFFRSAAHVLARFANRALTGQLPKPGRNSRLPSKAVIGNLLYVCRQLYSTCEGLMVLHSYQLSAAIAQAWRKVCEVDIALNFEHRNLYDTILKVIYS